MNRVLAFGCHPDDVEFICAGTLALLAQRGCEIHIAVMAGGDVGSSTLPRFMIREQRLKEAQAAADLIGARFHFAGGEDLEVEYNAAYRRRAVRTMREVNPTIVFTHSPMDYLIDFHFAGGEDLEMEYNAAYRRRAVRTMREVNPTIVFTHSPMDYLIDREETSRLVRNAAFIGTVPNYDCGADTGVDGRRRRPGGVRDRARFAFLPTCP